MYSKFLIVIITLFISFSGYSKKHKRVHRRHHRTSKRDRPHRRHYKKTKLYCVSYEVMPGDSPWSIARMFGTSTKYIFHHGRRVKRLRVGWNLRVCARWHLAPYIRHIYVVKKGDTLGKIARKLKVPLKSLKRWNRYKLRRRRYIRRGDRLVYLKRGRADSSSIGAPFAGRLMNGVQLPPGPGYTVREPVNSWGTQETIENILKAIACFRKLHPNAPKVVVADISRRYGGRLKRHKSHQSGRDVDIGIFGTVNNSETNLVDHRPREVNIPLTWDLINCFIKTGKVKLIFLDYWIQKRIYNYLKQHPEKMPPNMTFKDLIEYPRGKHSHVGLIRYEPGHRSHFHVRFVCPKHDGACHD